MGVGLDADGLEPDPSTRGRRPVATSNRSPRSSRPSSSSRTKSSPSRRARSRWPRTSSIPSRRSASPRASPSGAGSRASRCRRISMSAAPPPNRRTAWATRPDRAAAENEQPPRDHLQAGRLPVRPDALQLAQARHRRDDRVGAVREHDVRRPCGARRRPRPRPARRGGRCRGSGRCRGRPASAPGRRRRSRRPCSRARRARPRRRPPRVAAASRAPWTASPGRSSVFDGMHAQ